MELDSASGITKHPASVHAVPTRASSRGICFGAYHLVIGMWKPVGRACLGLGCHSSCIGGSGSTGDIDCQPSSKASVLALMMKLELGALGVRGDSVLAVEGNTCLKRP